MDSEVSTVNSDEREVRGSNLRFDNNFSLFLSLCLIGYGLCEEYPGNIFFCEKDEDITIE